MRQLITIVTLLLVNQNLVHAQSDDRIPGQVKHILPSETDPGKKIPDLSKDHSPYDCVNGFTVVDEEYEGENGLVIIGRKVPCKEEVKKIQEVRKGRVLRDEHKVNDDDLIPLELLPEEDSAYIPTRHGWKSTATKKIYGKEWLEKMRAKNPDFGKRSK